MRRWLGALVLVWGLAAPPVAADVCALVDRDTARRAALLIAESGTIVFDDWFAPLAVSTVAPVRHGNLYKVVVNDTLWLDLTYTYIAADRHSYRGHAPLVDRDLADMPPIIPRTPFGADIVATATPRLGPDPAGRLIGMLELPSLSGWDEGGQRDLRPVTVHEGPASDTPVTATFADWTGVAAREVGYELPGAAVLARRDGWFEVALDGGAGWIGPDDAGAYHGYPELVSDGLSYLTPAWNGRLRAAADPTAGAMIMAPAWRDHLDRELAIDVLKWREREGQLWFKITLLWPEPCSGDESRVYATGWIPGYDATGKATLWFYSRGR